MPLPPSAPALFSTMTVWLNFLPSSAASSRPCRAFWPPGGNGTMMVIGRAGHSARAGAAQAMASAASTANARTAEFSIVGFLFLRTLVDDAASLRAVRAQGLSEFARRGHRAAPACFATGKSARADRPVPVEHSGQRVRQRQHLLHVADADRQRHRAEQRQHRAGADAAAAHFVFRVDDPAEVAAEDERA